MKIFKTDKLLIALVAFISLVGCSKKNDPAPQKVVQQPVKPYKYNYGIESYMIINGDTLGLQGGNISAHLISTKDTAEYTRYTVEKNSVIGHEETKLTLYDIKHNGTYSKLLFINDSIRHYTAQTYFKFKYNNIWVSDKSWGLSDKVFT